MYGIMSYKLNQEENKMTKKEQLQAMLATMINNHGSDYGIKLELVEKDDTVIDVRYQGQLISIQIQ